MINPSQQQTIETMSEMCEAIDSLKGVNNTLIAQCDNFAQQKEYIAEYEMRLLPDMQPYWVSIQTNSFTLSLYLTLSELVAKYDLLQRNALITVVGIGGLSGDPLKYFIASLEYRREQLLRLPFTIVLWTNSETRQAIQREAPAFYQNARGVFLF
ncbi:hypothetical protein QT972_26660 [Microcoleus sp. herbarium7]|uniref:hypothetical protein n=1 Tax=Microcoleus sp. herbarium7 TaxID=3055435 RepID=UPI002FD73CA4